MKGKVSKSIMVYMSPAMATDSEGFKCLGCMQYVRDGSTCNIIDPDDDKVSASGVCAMYLPGEFQSNYVGFRMTKEDLGYVDHPTHCASCMFANKQATKCAIVRGPIQPNGCCNAWEGEK